MRAAPNAVLLRLDDFFCLSLMVPGEFHALCFQSLSAKHSSPFSSGCGWGGLAGEGPIRALQTHLPGAHRVEIPAVERVDLPSKTCVCAHLNNRKPEKEKRKKKIKSIF